MIGIINYGSGNIYAIANIYKRLDIPHGIFNDIGDLVKCDKLILPGVGAFDETMRLIAEQGMTDVLNNLVLQERIPIMGVCVGMQILGDSSEEGEEKGFSWIKGKIQKLSKEKLIQKPHLPHLGWNSIKIVKSSPLLNNIDEEKGFYFLHNYFFNATEHDDILATTSYGDEFPCVVNHKNIFGVQFHPEKSHDNGVEIFKNFAKL